MQINFSGHIIMNRRNLQEGRVHNFFFSELAMHRHFSFTLISEDRVIVIFHEKERKRNRMIRKCLALLIRSLTNQEDRKIP